VKRGRGGDCFQSNCAFWYLLRDLGYEVQFLPCRVFAGPQRGRRKPGFRAAPSHFALIVNDNFFVDVGMGEPPLAPIDLRSQEVQSIRGVDYRLVLLEKERTQLEWFRRGEWRPRLQWDQITNKTTRWRRDDSPTDLEPDRDFIMKAEKSPLTSKLIVSRLTSVDKLTISVSTQGARLKRTRHDEETTTPIPIADLRSALQLHFGIPLTETHDLDVSKSLQAPPLW